MQLEKRAKVVFLRKKKISYMLYDEDYRETSGKSFNFFINRKGQ